MTRGPTVDELSLHDTLALHDALAVTGELTLDEELLELAGEDVLFDELETAWFDAEFSALIADQWGGECTPPTRPSPPARRPRWPGGDAPGWMADSPTTRQVTDDPHTPRQRSPPSL